MKQSSSELRPHKRDYRELYTTLAALQSGNEVRDFLADLCTPAELEAMADRWRAVRKLQQGLSYREISESTGISVTTVGRVARCLAMGSGGYQIALERTRKRKNVS